MTPRDLKVAPSDLFLHPNAEVFTEREGGLANG